MKSTIKLGYTVGGMHEPSGMQIDIPIGHMAVTGQTQAAGKTTTLEALASRLPDDFTILAFSTKRGEGGFTNGVVDVPPYFRERADWEFVSSILEATMRERMKFERGWIMRASKGAATLADVQRNVKTLMASAKGLSADIYYQLDAYLDKVVPQVKALGPARSLTLQRTAGPNVMDLTSFSLEMQGLIIASCLDFVYKHATKTIVVIPEAWEFIPRGRNAPVTIAAEALIRKGATLKNYLWIDSQDLAGVHTPILKQIGVWLLGVQREINEIKRTLAHVHTPKKPKADDIAALGLGEFIACFGRDVVTVYVQPAWMTDVAARKASMGVPYIATQEAATQRMKRSARLTGFRPVEEDPMDAQLKAENEELRRKNAAQGDVIEQLRQENQELHQRLERVEARLAGHESARDSGPPRRAGTSRLEGRPLDDDGAIELRKVPAPYVTLPLGTWPAIRAQILNDEQVLLKIASIRPELIVELTPRVTAIDGTSLKGRIARLIAQGWINSEPKRPGEINKELNRTGGQVHAANLGRALNDFVLDGFLTRESDGGYAKSAACTVTTRELQVV